MTWPPPYQMMRTNPMLEMNVARGMKKALIRAMVMFMSKNPWSSVENFSSSYSSLLKPLTTLTPARFSWSTEVMTPFCSLTAAQRGPILLENSLVARKTKGITVTDISVSVGLMETKE